MVGGSRQVFISYARSDAHRVTALVEGLRQLHYDTWLDEDLTGGQAWWDAILSQIRASSAVLVAVSPAALESVAVRREHEYGHAVGRPLLPVIVATVRLETLPPLLAPLQVVDYRGTGTKSAFALAAALAALPAPRALPRPLPDPPPIPISYLSELKERSQATALSMDEQLALIARLKVALARASEREAAEEVLRSLEKRNDLYQVSAREIEFLLSPLDRQVPRPPPREGASARPKGASTGEWGVRQIDEKAETVRHDQARAAQLIAEAERIAYSAAEYVRDFPLAALAGALAVIDPDRAEDITRSITNDFSRAHALTDIAKTLADTDPDRAERIARSITEDFSKTQALSDIAKTLADTDPARAERIARSITDQSSMATALTWIARTLAPTDPDRAARLIADAERIAVASTDEATRVNVLADVAEALAASDPDRAERVARSIPDRWVKASVLPLVARTLAGTDAGRAERIVRSWTDETEKAWALANIATTLATTDPDRAERIARAITDKFSKAWALANIATTVGATDPERAAWLTAYAERLAYSAEKVVRRLRGLSRKPEALRSVAEALAPTAPDHAERVAQSITDEVERRWALGNVATTLATTDPDRAVRIA